MFLVFLVAENLKNTIPVVVARVERVVFLVFLAAENLKNTIPALWSWDGLSGNRVFGVFSCRKS